MEIRGSNILVTGGTGCVGMELLNFLDCEKPQKVVLIGRKKDFNLPDIENLVYVSGDISNSKFMDEQIKNMDFVIHLAAKVHSIPKNKEEEDEFYKVNTRASHEIFRLASVHKVKKLIFISTVAVFGDKGDKEVKEEELCDPSTDYGKSKLLAEKSLIKLSREKSLPMTILRPVTVFGNLDNGNIAKLILMLKKGFGIVVAGGINKKSFVYSKDLARAIIEALKNENTNGQTYIISGFTVSVKEFLDVGKKIFNPKSCTISIPLFIIKIIRKISNMAYVKLNALMRTNIYDGSKFFRETGFEVKFGLEAGLKDSYDYYKNLH